MPRSETILMWLKARTDPNARNKRLQTSWSPYLNFCVTRVFEGNTPLHNFISKGPKRSQYKPQELAHDFVHKTTKVQYPIPNLQIIKNLVPKPNPGSLRFQNPENLHMNINEWMYEIKHTKKIWPLLGFLCIMLIKQNNFTCDF